MLLEGKIAVVTGAANGIGRAIALRLANEGGDLAILDREKEALAETAAEVRAQGRRVIDLVVDMTDRAAIDAAFDRIATELGPVDVLVNNVGGSLRDRAGPFWSVDPSTWQEMVELCYLPGMACAYRVIEGMIAKRGGKIVNMASDSGIVGSRANAAYSAAKAGVVGFTRALARELAAYRINVNAIAPGYIRTRAMERIPQDLIEKAIAETPLGFMGEPEDVANAVAFLATEQSRYITGQTLIVNGGRWFN
jgi:NAD(P)-dependent dehydrogenase (short-subunit alcohol dehydrogenase family)